MGIKKISLGRRTAPPALLPKPRRRAHRVRQGGAGRAAWAAARSNDVGLAVAHAVLVPAAGADGGVVVSLLALLASVYLDNRQATNGAAQIEIAGDMLMHSQRLGKAVPVALLGNAQAFTQLRQSKEQLTADLLALQNGSDEKHVRATTGPGEPLLEKAFSWKRPKRAPPTCWPSSPS
jgi:twitching motility protein PilJ